MKDLLLFTELTDSEQETISGGQDSAVLSAVIIDGGGTVITQCGDKITLPNGTIVEDKNCFDDPYPRYYPPYYPHY